MEANPPPSSSYSTTSFPSSLPFIYASFIPPDKESKKCKKRRALTTFDCDDGRDASAYLSHDLGGFLSRFSGCGGGGGGFVNDGVKSVDQYANWRLTF